MVKYVYMFNEGNASMRNLLGGKGANLAEMTSLGLPVPRGFTITTEACTRYYEDGQVISKEIEDEIYATLTKLEESIGKRFGDPGNPLLVSVRSGARASMPGMMDTILNLGLNDEVVVGLAKLTNNERFAYDSYRRFIQMFSDVVMEIEKLNFDKIFDAAKERKGVELDTELDAEDLKNVVKEYKEVFKKIKGFDFPQEPRAQLLESIKAVFRSWNNPRAIYYRRMNDIPSSWGTAVNVQEMVLVTWEMIAELVLLSQEIHLPARTNFMVNFNECPGEDVVAGIRTPQPIDTLEDVNPKYISNFMILQKNLKTL